MNSSRCRIAAGTMSCRTTSVFERVEQSASARAAVAPPPSLAGRPPRPAAFLIRMIRVIRLTHFFRGCYFGAASRMRARRRSRKSEGVEGLQATKNHNGSVVCSAIARRTSGGVCGCRATFSRTAE